MLRQADPTTARSIDATMALTSSSSVRQFDTDNRMPNSPFQTVELGSVAFSDHGREDVLGTLLR